MAHLYFPSNIGHFFHAFRLACWLWGTGLGLVVSFKPSVFFLSGLQGVRGSIAREKAGRLSPDQNSVVSFSSHPATPVTHFFSLLRTYYWRD